MKRKRTRTRTEEEAEEGGQQEEWSSGSSSSSSSRRRRLAKKTRRRSGRGRGRRKRNRRRRRRRKRGVRGAGGGREQQLLLLQEEEEDENGEKEQEEEGRGRRRRRADLSANQHSMAVSMARSCWKLRAWWAQTRSGLTVRCSRRRSRAGLRAAALPMELVAEARDVRRRLPMLLLDARSFFATWKMRIGLPCPITAAAHISVLSDIHVSQKEQRPQGKVRREGIEGRGCRGRGGGRGWKGGGRGEEGRGGEGGAESALGHDSRSCWQKPWREGNWGVRE